MEGGARIMTLLQMIEEWRKGCSCAMHKPENCPECILTLIDAMEFKLKKQAALEKLKIKYELEMLNIKNNFHGMAVTALSLSCLARYVAQVKVIRSYSPIKKCKKNEGRVVSVNLKGQGLSSGEVDEIIKSINKAFCFNYPECLNRIVDVAVARAESEILRFAEADEVARKHEEMMSMMSRPIGGGGVGGDGCYVGGIPIKNFLFGEKK